MRTLLIDDDQRDRKHISMLLKATGIAVEITEVGDAIAAMDVIANKAFDCLLVDQQLPGTLGTEFVRTYRGMKAAPRTPIVVLSGDDRHTTTSQEAASAGSDFFMAKRDMTATRLKAVLRCLTPGPITDRG